ncbi:MAG: thiamine pyrophosphate-dependent enzyme [Patescibacteria group bacterium]
MLEKIAHTFECQMAEFVSVAKNRYRSWKDRPEYLTLLKESLERLHAHIALCDENLGRALLTTVLENRLFNESVLASYRAGEFKGALLDNFGQEAVGSGIGHAMRAGDILARDHRNASAALARGMPVYDLWTMHLMRATSPTGGYDPNLHFGDLKRNDLGFLASDMAMAAVLINGATWYRNRFEEHHERTPLAPDKRIAGVAIIGDGASTNGLAHAGMQFAKSWQLPVVFAIHNNQISLRTPPREEYGGIDLSNRAVAYEMPMLTLDGDNAFEMYLGTWFLLDFARHANHPALINAVTFRRSGHNRTERTDYLKHLYDPAFLGIWMGRESDPLFKTRMACEELGYVGANAYAELRDTVKRRVEDAHQKALLDPEPTPENYRSTLMEPANTTVAALAQAHPAHGPTRRMTFKEALQSALREEFAHDPLLHMIGEDVGFPGGGVFEVTAPLLTEWRGRLHNTPLDEAAIGGFVVGAGLVGGRVIGEYQFWNFFLAGPSPLLTIAATRPFMNRVGIPGVMRGPVGYAPQSNHYHENWVETWLLKALGIKVVVPATPEDAKGLLKSAVRDPDMVAFLEEMSFYGVAGTVPEGEYFTPFTAIVRREGEDVTLVTYGPKMLQLALSSAETLATQNDISVEVIDLRILNPWDKETVLASVRKTGRLVVLHEDSRFMGFGAEISASIAEDEAFYELRGRIKRIAALNSPIPAHLVLENYRLPNEHMVVDAIKTLTQEA